MSQITTHILDTSKGQPAAGVEIRLEKHIRGNEWIEMGSGQTNEDGRLPGLVAAHKFLELGIYRLVFETDAYYKRIGEEGLYPWVSIAFRVSEDRHYHIPLLLNPYGYSTYRGS